MNPIVPAVHFRLSHLLAASSVLLVVLGAAAPDDAGKAPAKVGEGPALPVTVAGHVGGIVTGVPVVAGGTTWSEDRQTKRWLRECFVFEGGAWKPGPPLPQALADAAYAADSSGLYVAGGTMGKEESSAAVFHLKDPSPRSAWQPLAALPAPLDGAAGAIAEHRFYIAGGFSQGKASNRLLALDVNNPNATWRTLAPVPAPGRAYAALVACGSSLYLFGGFVSPPYESQTRIFSDAYCYDLALDRWQKLERFELPGYGWTATTVGANRVMLTGRVPKPGLISDEVWLVHLPDLLAEPIGRLVTPACCMPVIQVSLHTWWVSGGEPDVQRSRTARTSVVSLEGTSDK